MALVHVNMALKTTTGVIVLFLDGTVEQRLLFW